MTLCFSVSEQQFEILVADGKVLLGESFKLVKRKSLRYQRAAGISGTLSLWLERSVIRHICPRGSEGFVLV